MDQVLRRVLQGPQEVQTGQVEDCLDDDDDDDDNDDDHGAAVLSIVVVVVRYLLVLLLSGGGGLESSSPASSPARTKNFRRSLTDTPVAQTSPMRWAIGPNSK